MVTIEKLMILLYSFLPRLGKVPLRFPSPKTWKQGGAAILFGLTISLFRNQKKHITPCTLK